MNKEKQRIKIAEACGWTEISERCMWGLPPNAIDDGTEDCLRHFPKYESDLNAMHDAKNTLTDTQKRKWGELCVDMTNNFPQHIVLCCKNSVSGENIFTVSNLTAAQESELFLKTLGLWEEGG